MYDDFEIPWPAFYRETPVPLNPDVLFQAPWNLDPVAAETSMLACATLLDAVEVALFRVPPSLRTTFQDRDKAETAFGLGRYAAWIRGFVEHHGPEAARDAAQVLRGPATRGMDRGEFERLLRGFEGDPDDLGPAWKAHLEAWRVVKRRVKNAMLVRDLIMFTVGQVWEGKDPPRIRRWIKLRSKASKPSAYFAAWVCTVLGLGPGACFAISGRHPGELHFWRTVLEGMTRDYAGCERAHRILDRISPVDLPELPPPEFPTPRSRESLAVAIRNRTRRRLKKRDRIEQSLS